MTRDVRPHDCPKCAYYLGLRENQKEVDKLRNIISYALAQETNNYGMSETEAAQFRCRKVMSVLSEALEDDVDQE